MNLVPEQYQGLVWFLFPSQVIGELQSLKKNKLTFKALEALSQNSQNGSFNTPFIPKDYNKNQYVFEFSKEYMEDRDGLTSTEDS